MLNRAAMKREAATAALAATAMLTVGCGGVGTAKTAPSTSVATSPLLGAAVLKVDPSLGTFVTLSTLAGQRCDGDAQTRGPQFDFVRIFGSALKGLTAGTPIQVNDESGKTVGTGALGSGIWDSQGKTCRMPFGIVVGPAKFYRVRIANLPEQTFPAGTSAEVAFQG